MPKRILVLSASVGAGHLRAAQAVELALRELDPDAVVRNVDVLELTNVVFRRLYGKAYLDLVNRAPHVLGYFYDLMDRPPGPGTRTDRLRHLGERLNLRRFVKFLHDEPWDVIVNTHFLPAELVAGLRNSGALRTPQFTVTTDFETHRLWVNQPCELYFTATLEGAAYLQHWGIPASDTRVTGIPIHPVFSRPKDRGACLARQGLNGDRPVVLQLAGGFGVGPVELLFQALLSIERPLEIVVVAGKNAELKQRLEGAPIPPRHSARVLGFTDQMDELLTVADLVVSKPGGLTTSETLARGAALAIVNPIPGQEARNSDFLLEHGAAIKINNTGTLAFKLSQLFGDPGRLEALKASARRLGRPQAAFDVARAALEWGTR
jgi:processive 1,2-diacylglycerol beta-glucosyltransferase